MGTAMGEAAGQMILVDEAGRPVQRGLGPLVAHLKARYGERIAGELVQPAVPARFAPLPAGLHPGLAAALRGRGLERLYRHQAEVWDLVRAGRHAVVATPTASGKTLCYNLPVLDAVLGRGAKALYLFPTKALAQDQVAELTELNRAGDLGIKAFTFDGDTPGDARKAVRTRGDIVVSNPDMLHQAILPHHTKWAQFFEGLQFVVVDELHGYRGVFGSHVANVLRRLKRVCRFYGTDPCFIFASATIANPCELAERLIGSKVAAVTQSGAPLGERRLLLWNPPVINPDLGIRASARSQTTRIARATLRAGLKAIVFAGSRLQVEVITKYLKDAFDRQGRGSPPRGMEPEGDDRQGRGSPPRGMEPEGDDRQGPGSPPSGMEAEGGDRDPRRPSRVLAYRGGYLPSERRAAERAMRAGEVGVVVSTSALELGVDIGSLDVAILNGYPGTVAATWQRLGRAGRRLRPSLGVLVASSDPLDQYLVRHPEYFLGASPEHARIHPDQLLILLDHVRCAAFELPFTEGETFGGEDLPEMLGYLEGQGILQRQGGRWYWVADAYPANAVSLRSVAEGNFVVIDLADSKVLAEVDWTGAPSTLYEGAIYMIQARPYQVERLDWLGRKAFVRVTEADYYTDAVDYTRLKILDRFEARAGAKQGSGGLAAHGEVHLVRRFPGYKKIRYYTHDNVGYGNIHLPDQALHTTAVWWQADPLALAAALPQRQLAVEGFLGAAYALHHVAALRAMAELRDLGRSVGDGEGTWFATVGPDGRGQLRGAEGQAADLAGRFEPTLFLYDNYPGGIGLSAPLFDGAAQLVVDAQGLVAGCPCAAGCPACVGPVLPGEEARAVTPKAAAARVLYLLGAAEGEAVVHAAE